MDTHLEVFRSYLISQSATESTIKNYLGDLKYFLSFLRGTLIKNGIALDENIYELLHLLTAAELDNYVNFLKTQGLSVPTVNRKISSLKSYFQLAYHQGWIDINFTKHLSFIKNEVRLSLKSLLSGFEEDLRREGVGLVSRKNYLSDVKQFITWLNATQKATM